MTKATQRIRPDTRLVDQSGLPTREGFNFFRELFDQVQGLETLPVFTAAQIASSTSNANTINKAQGRRVYDSTNNRMMIADGAGATDDWYVCDGSASVTPS